MNKLPSVPAIWWLAAAAVAAITAGAITPATAQDYPTRPVRMIIPFPPGGSNDVVGRLIRPPTATRCSSFPSRMPSIRGFTSSPMTRSRTSRLQHT
jgi:hypothetical protein